MRKIRMWIKYYCDVMKWRKTLNRKSKLIKEMVSKFKKIRYTENEINVLIIRVKIETEMAMYKIMLGSRPKKPGTLKPGGIVMSAKD